MDQKEGFSIDDDYDTTSERPVEYSQPAGRVTPKPSTLHTAPQQHPAGPAPRPAATPQRPAGPVRRPATPTDGGSSVPPQRPATAQGSGGNNKWMLIAIIVLSLIVIGGVVAFLWYTDQQKKEIERVLTEKEAAELSFQEQMAQQDMANLEEEFQDIENPRSLVTTDSVKMRLTEKYESARLEVEKLQRELKDTRNKSAKEISDLRAQIATLRALLKHYIEEINRLNAENEALRTENAEVKQNNERLTQQVQQTTRENDRLTERMTLAEKLNVSGVSLQALNGKGKVEKKVKKAKQLVVNFTIPQNNSTPVGEKTIYCRITTPEGQLLEGGGSFKFEGATLAASAKKTIEYAGQEIAGIKIYYDVRTAINPGSYTVELFADNFRLTSQHFTLK